MSDQNICSGLDVTHVEVDNHWAAMYDAQVRLQERLGVMPSDFSDLRKVAHKCIYWEHCINDEIYELLEWFGHNKSSVDGWGKEVHMEAIDILHFVLNLGMEIGLTKEEFILMEPNFHYEPRNECVNTYHITSIERATDRLRRSVIDFIAAMPWKNWKSYNDVAFTTFVQKATPYYVNVMTDCIRLCQAVCLNKQDIINIYMAKNRENHRRQDDGYGD